MKFYTKHALRIAGLICIFFFLSACYDDEIPPPIITRTVSFSQDLIPIFNDKCNNISCHGFGGISPDLTPANAFVSLDSLGYINRDDPESSIIYQRMEGNIFLVMPPNGKNPVDNALVLAWIQQGAQNN